MKKLFLIASILALFTNLSLKSEEPPPFKISARIAMNIPLGQFSDYWGTGFGASGSFDYFIVDNISVGIASGWHFWNPNFETAPGFSDAYTVIPLLFSVKYYFIGGGLLPYAGAEYGMHFMDRSVSDPLQKDVSASDETGLSLTFGILKQLNYDLDLDAAIRYTNIFTESSLSYFGLEAGVAIYL